MKWLTELEPFSFERAARWLQLRLGHSGRSILFIKQFSQYKNKLKTVTWLTPRCTKILNFDFGVRFGHIKNFNGYFNVYSIPSTDCPGWTWSQTVSRMLDHKNYCTRSRFRVNFGQESPHNSGTYPFVSRASFNLCFNDFKLGRKRPGLFKLFVQVNKTNPFMPIYLHHYKN